MKTIRTLGLMFLLAVALLLSGGKPLAAPFVLVASVSVPSVSQVVVGRRTSVPITVAPRN